MVSFGGVEEEGALSPHAFLWSALDSSWKEKASNTDTFLVHFSFFQSMHGGSECDGNAQQLCVRDNKDVTQREWWNFIQCQNFQDLNRVGDISLAKQCAKVIGKDWDNDFSDCYTGSRGGKLLRKSGMSTISLRQ